MPTSSSAASLDLSFVQLPLDNPWLETILVLQDDYVLVTAADSAFAAGGRVPTLREIAEQPLIGFRNCRATELVVDQIRAAGREPHFVFRSDENGVVQGLARAGIGVAVIPRLAVDPNDEAVRITNLSPRIAAAPGRDRPPQGPLPLARGPGASSRPRSRSAPRRPPRSQPRLPAGNAGRRRYSTVTVFARFRGWSTFRPRSRAIR